MLTADLNGGLQLQEVRLAEKDLLCCETELPDLLLGQIDLFSRTTITHLEQALNDVVQEGLILQRESGKRGRESFGLGHDVKIR